MGNLTRRRIDVYGEVQGVGFRPFVYGLATELRLAGSVANTAQGASIDIEGLPEVIEEFLRRLPCELPFPGKVLRMEASVLEPQSAGEFLIGESAHSGPKKAHVLPDIATCPKCLAEMRDASDRRYRYPFINCTHCGPRYSIILQLPYDRPNTTMAGFTMCANCRAEYEDQSDRRFHAQPIACPACGPQLAFWDSSGSELAVREEALERACRLLESGGILALKGIGGFHLMVDARAEDDVVRLRQRKGREAKPFAVMIPSRKWAQEALDLDPDSERVLFSAEAPIVIAKTRGASVAPSVAPVNPNLGVLAPHSPLHWLIMERLGFPVVATSGNLTDEPICTGEREAVERFRNIADGLLVHDRPIARPIDDSVVSVMAAGPVVFRRARGYAPATVPLKNSTRRVLAIGGHLKNSVALSLEGEAVVGQHVGDLDSLGARERMESEAADLADLYGCEPKAIVHDLHPDYASTRFAESSGKPLLGVQHHIAHAAACLSENEIEGPALVVVWDGTGYGTDGSIWGGEFFEVSNDGVERVARIRPFSLPGGDAAVREPRRSAVGLLQEAYRDMLPEVFQEWVEVSLTRQEVAGLGSQIRRRAIRTSSAGRLFDAFAALGAGILHSRFEGDAPMRFEHLADGSCDGSGYKFGILSSREAPHEVDWIPALGQLADDLRAKIPPSLISARFHAGLAEAIARFAERIGFRHVGLSGGCFQNRLLFEETWRRLEQRGFQPFGHQRIPPGDGGLAFGQLAAVAKGWCSYPPPTH